MESYVSDHSADNAVTGSDEKLKKLYADIKRDGIDSIRYDWRWDKIQPTPDRFSHEHLERYKRAKELMEEAGLGPPTIILSNIPSWAKRSYAHNREAFFNRFARYAAVVSDTLCDAQGEKVTTVQVLNELNNTWFTPVSVQELPRLCEATRFAFGYRKCYPHIKVMGTVLAANVPGLAPKITMGKVSF